PSLPERHPEQFEQAARLLVGLRRRDDADVETARGVHLVVLDLGEHHLLTYAEAVVAATVEAVRRHASEVAYARKRDVDETLEQQPLPRATQRHTQSHRHAGADLEVGNRLLGARHGRALQRDLRQLPARPLHDLGVLTGLAEAHVDDDLLDARNRHDVSVAVTLDELRLDVLVALLAW